VSRAARTLSAVVAVVCCLAPAAVTPVQADSGRDARHDRPSRGVDRPQVRAPVAPERQPLAIETLTPARLLPGTPVRVTGTVLNDTDEVWGDAQVGLLASQMPFTTPAQVAAATRADPYQDFTGDQVLAPGTFDDIGDIAPGQSRSFSLTVPYAELQVDGGDGAYWIGAEIRATDGQGLRGSVARTLTFMPLVGDAANAPTVDLAVLWPLLAPVPWNGQEFVDDSLSAQFTDGGRLRTLAALGARAGDQPLTWVIDPAVLEAAERMSDGFERGEQELGADSDPARAAASWLNLVRSSLDSSVALALPYGNPDVAALAHASVHGMRRAQRAGDLVLDNLGIARQQLLWPPAGYTDRAILRATRRQLGAEVALLSRDTFDEPPAEGVVGLPRRTRSSQPQPAPAQPALVTDPEKNRGGLRAQPGQSTLQWRQLVLANTALRALSGDTTRRTAVAMPSRRWWPDAAWRDAELFDELQAPWINRVTANTLTSGPKRTYAGGFRYPPAARRRELGRPILNTVKRVRRTARTVNNLLADSAGNLELTDRAFGLSSSTAWRTDRRTGREVATDYLATHQTMIRSIDIEAPEFVTLSSNSGRFPVSITNGLNQPITVGLAVTARDPRMTVEAAGPVTLQRDQRVTVTVQTRARGVGITTLTARMLTQQGRPFGPMATFQVRTTQIGAVVWVVIGVGTAVLFIAAGRRIFLRVRGHRRRVRGAR
jgi:hypothetical protein